MSLTRQLCGLAARAAAGAIAAAVIAAAAAETASAWRLFTIVDPEYGRYVVDVAPLPDGTILVADDDQVFRRGWGGRERLFAGKDFPSVLGDGGPADQARLDLVRDVSALPGGGALIAAGDLIRHVAPDGTITTVAGTVAWDGDSWYGASGYSGDGGPATAAHLCEPTETAPLPDGGFLIVDSGNSLIRRVWPDGTITTVAGVPPGPERTPGYVCGGPRVRSLAGDGGPATAARLSGPTSVAPLADGGFVIADGGNDRLRRVDPAGTITTVPGITTPWSVVASPDGGYAVAANGGVWLAGPAGPPTPIGGGGPPPSELFKLGDDEGVQAGLFNGEGLDARSIGFSGALAADPLGGFLVTDSRRVSLLAEPPSGRMGIAIRRVRAPARKPRLVYVATAPGRLVVRARTGNRGLGPLWRGPAVAGAGTVPLPKLPKDGYVLTVRAVAGNGTRDLDRLGIVLGGRLPVWVAASALARFECDCHGDAPDTTEYLGQCRRFGARRVDCRINARELNSCEYVGSATLRSSGFVWTRTYGCPMRRNPRRLSRPSAAPLL
jgi:hypothetical protein